MAAPTQKGNQLVTKAAPTFTKVVVVSKTWKEKDALATEEILDGNDETYNYTGTNPGVDATAEWVVKTGQTPPVKMEVVTATYPDASTKKFIILDLENAFSNGVFKQTVSLAYRDSVASALS